MEDNTSKKLPLLYSILFGLQNENYAPSNINMFNSNNENIPVRHMEQSMNPYNTTYPVEQGSQSHIGIKTMGKSRANQGNDSSLFDQRDQPKPLMFD